MPHLQRKDRNPHFVVDNTLALCDTRDTLKERLNHMLQRRHFQEIADILLANNTPVEKVKEFADVLANTNPNFNADRFVLAAMNWE